MADSVSITVVSDNSCVAFSDVGDKVFVLVEMVCVLEMVVLVKAVSVVGLVVDVPLLGVTDDDVFRDVELLMDVAIGESVTAGMLPLVVCEVAF